MKRILAHNKTISIVATLLSNGCALFDDGYIEKTCEDFPECFPTNDLPQSQNQNDTNLDTSVDDTQDTDTGSTQYYIPDRFYVVANIGIVNEQAATSTSWDNQLLIVLAKDDGNLYPDMNGTCIVNLTTSTPVWPVDNTIQHTWYGTFPQFDVASYTPLCNQVEPLFLESTIAEIKSSQWKIGIGELSNATRTEFSTYMQSMLGGEDQAMYSYAATLYIQTTWGGSDLVVSPGAILAHPFEQQTLNQDEFLVLQNATAPPDGYYFSYPLFHYAIPSE